jgi:DNA-binding NarL/FixJ family response regulator
MSNQEIIKVGMADDHVLLRQGLATMINNLGNCKVIWQASNGLEVKELIAKEVPDVMLLDIRMPEMNGFETCAWLTRHHKSVKVLALSMMDEETAVIKMLKSGAKGYLLKDSEPMDLANAIRMVHEQGFFFNEMVTGKLLHSILQENLDVDDKHDDRFHLSAREKEFLQLVCTEYTYREIADIMKMSPRTIDGYRDVLFDRLGIKSRVGLVLYAIRRGIYIP